MAENCRYEAQLREACRLVADGAGHPTWQLVYQSRSGSPQQPWLEPDICDVIRQQHAQGDLVDLVVVPIGFVSDHMEVLFDLDTEAQQVCRALGVNMLRVPTVGTDSRLVSMIRELVEERQDDQIERKALGEMGPSHDVCPSDCCLYTPSRPGSG